MIKKTLTDINFKDKKVLVRVDFNVPISNGVITDDNRIRSALPTINYLLSVGAKIILLSHLGRIKSVSDLPNNSLEPVAIRLAELLGRNVTFVNQIKGPKLERTIRQLKSQEILLMENTRFADVDNHCESNNDATLAKYWANLGDVFVFDAFGAAHRSNASTVGIASYCKESCVGILVQTELEMLHQTIDNPVHPVVVILGGSKVSDKIGVIDHLLKIADKIIIGGAMAYTFLKAQGFKVGNSLVEEDKIKLAKRYLKQSQGKIILPIDHMISKEFKDNIGVNSIDENIPDGYIGMDIGAKSIKLFSEYIEQGKTIIWNGPMGVFEMQNFNKGTLEICQTIAKLSEVFSIIGGGDSAAAAIQLGFKDKFSHISTGGGASLVLLEGKPLVAIDAIQNK